MRSSLITCLPAIVLALCVLDGCGREPAPLPGAASSTSTPAAAPADQVPQAAVSAPEGQMPEAGTAPAAQDPHAGMTMPGGSDPHAGMTMPGGSDPHAGMAMPGMPGAQGSPAPAGSRALKPQGIGSEAEMAKALAKLGDNALKARFEEGFRASFSVNQAERDYVLAADAANEVLAKVPNFAPAYRVLAYAKLNNGFDMQGSTEFYKKAIAADPNYGEAHYGLAFMLTQLDPEAGRKHFEKAMELGIPDERDLRSRFYPPKS